MADYVVNVATRQVVVTPFGSELVGQLVQRAEDAAAESEAAKNAAVAAASYGPEVEAARGGEASLNARFDLIEAFGRGDADGNVFLSQFAGVSITTGIQNSGSGDGALRDTTTGDNNTADGYAAGRNNIGGAGNVFNGSAAGLTATAASEGVFVGWEAGGYGALGARIVLIGRAAGDYYAGADTVGVGAYALNAITGGTRLTALGAYAGAGAGNVGFESVYLGYNAGGSGIGHVPASNQTVLGAGAIATLPNQVTLGAENAETIRAFGMIAMRGYAAQRTWFAGNAGNQSAGNLGCIGIGEVVLVNSTSSTNVIGIGDLALQFHTGSNGPIAIGSLAMNQSLTINDTVVVGTNGLRYATTGVGNTNVGYRTMEHATAARNVTTLGDSAFWRYQGTGGIGIGYVVAELTQSGDNAIYVGIAAGRYCKSGADRILIGAEAGSFYDASGVDIEANLGAVDGGARVLGVGYRSLARTTGADFIALGHQSGLSLTSGSSNIYIGNNAANNGSQKVNATNQIIIAHNGWSANDNVIILGDATNDNFIVCGVSFSATELADLKALVA
jgi:hypothetical protein